MKVRGWLNLAVVSLGVSWSTLGHGYEPFSIPVPNKTPKELEGIGIEEKLGAKLSLDRPFVSDEGNAVQLGTYFTGDKPVLLTVVYFNCPGLCNLHLNGVVDALKQMSWAPGNQFELVAVSMDASEKPEVAAPKKANYISQYGRPETASGWHFLTGTKEDVDSLTKEVGFSFRWDEAAKQFAHASAAIIVTPAGVVSRYIHGIAPTPQNLKLALLEASDGKVGSIVDKLVMLCFKFDPKKSKYTLYAWNIMQVGVVLTVLIAAILLIPVWWRERRTARHE